MIQPAAEPTPTPDPDSGYQIPDSQNISKRLSPVEKVGVTLGRWFSATLNKQQDELISQCTNYAAANMYTEITPEVLVGTYRYVTK